MFSSLFRSSHGFRSAELERLADPDLDPELEPDPDPDLDPNPNPNLSRDNSLLPQNDSPGPASHRAYVQLRHATADFTEADDDEDDSNDEENHAIHDDPSGHEDAVDEDGGTRASHVLPLFSATHLDALPVYSIVHAIRIIVQARTDTMLTWDQLRSPQVSQFLVKPMQQLVRTHHFSRATLYALMANCLQFAKEGQLFPGMAGTCSTRAKVCELLCMKLLKEYSTRELIDALSYDFNPLQGIPTGPQSMQRLSTTARTSTLEVAIRANAKHFLAHPLVVQQLEAIWNGAISFYSSADYLHRNKGKSPDLSHAGSDRGFSWTSRRSSTARVLGGGRRSNSDLLTPLLGGSYGGTAYHQQPHSKEDHGRPSQPLPYHQSQHHHQHQHPNQHQQAGSSEQPPRRRTVTLYNPRNASLFKLSRLRVPRYRQFLSTCSLAVLIGLFLAVLIQHSSRITTLELVFWFWSAGFMLDELVGFTEQGFSLYIMSFWNIFDLGILLLLIFYYSLRVCGVFLADAQRWNDSAYDILAANAILLLPRIFSVLDHYQYFSQLLIAFRLMAVDLAAVLVLIVISCSGFFVFFTFSRSDTDPSDIAYKIFQIVMGFTPAAWEVWTTYNYLGKFLMGFFLVICHFVIVTILVTVLSNSFMEIASNANEEHQFLFAINTISMVKNDALFSYIAPTNIFAWMMMPLRYCMPLPHFVALNRLVIKITHFPLLFGIFIYEKFFLAHFMYEPTDLVENSRRARQRIISFADPTTRPSFAPSIRLREESVVGYQKDRALDEVFRRTPDIASLRTHRRNERRKTQTAVRNWMDHNDGMTVSNYSMEGLSVPRERSMPRFRHISEVRSAASDPADLMSVSAYPGPRAVESREFLRGGGGDFDAGSGFKDHADANEGDDELVTNDEDEDNTTNAGDQQRVTASHHDRGGTEIESHGQGHAAGYGEGDEDGEEDSDEDGAFMPTPTASRFLNMAARSPPSVKGGSPRKKADQYQFQQMQQMQQIQQMQQMQQLHQFQQEQQHFSGGYESSTTHDEDEEETPVANRSATRRALHMRALSTNTILYNPPVAESGDEENMLPHPLQSPFHSPKLHSPPSPKAPVLQPRPRPRNGPQPSSGGMSPGQRSPRRSFHPPAAGAGTAAVVTTATTATGATTPASTMARPQPILPPRSQLKRQPGSPNGNPLNALGHPSKPVTTPVKDTAARRAQRRLSFFDTGTEAPSSDLASVVMSAPLADEAAAFGTLPGSFTSQLALAQAMNARANGESDRDRDRMSRLVLARMKTLEESFTDVVKELRQLQKQQPKMSNATSRAASDAEEERQREDLTMASIGGGGGGGGSRAEATGRRRGAAASASSSSEGVSRPGSAGGRGKKAKGKEVEQGEYGGLYVAGK